MDRFVHYTQQRDENNQRILLQGSCNKISRTITTTFILSMFLSHLIFPINSAKFNINEEETKKLRFVRDHLNKINKPAVKTILSPDGDIIDCVLSHMQPAFDHPKLKGQKPLDQPEMPKTKTGTNNNNISYEILQLWSMRDGYCPEGTVPIRRTSEDDLFRARDYRRFGKKIFNSSYASPGNGHEYAVGSVQGGEYYGAKASINVWAPKVANEHEFSLAQLSLVAGTIGVDLNTVIAGWQVSPELYGDNLPRLFTYWSKDADKDTGCYNLLCPGFVHTNNKFVLGEAISPTSSYNGGQFDINIFIFKDPKNGNWWLAIGDNILIGYWPSVLFIRLNDHASMVQFGGEIVNTGSSGAHTTTQMGSGHFAEEGFRKAAYFRNLKTVDSNNNLIPLSSDLLCFPDHPKCYDIKPRTSKDWGSYFFYGGPGNNPNCP